MNILNLINGIILVVGVPTIAGALIYIVRKLQTLDKLSADVDVIKRSLTAVTSYLIRHHPKFDHRELKTF